MKLIIRAFEQWKNAFTYWATKIWSDSMPNQTAQLDLLVEGVIANAKTAGFSREDALRILCEANRIEPFEAPMYWHFAIQTIYAN